MLKLRRREVEVSSTLLWQMLLRDREANSPWQRLRRNLLLFLQLLLLLALVLALARPFWPVPTIATGTLVVLLDGSASMNDRRRGRRRHRASRRPAPAVRQLIDGLGADGNMSLILVGQPAGGAGADDRQQRRPARRPGSGPARPRPPPIGTRPWPWRPAPSAPASADNSIIVIISDGGLPDDLPPMPAEVRYVPIGSSADNLALRGPGPAARRERAAAVCQRGQSRPRRARGHRLVLSRRAALYSAEQLTCPPARPASVVLDALPPEPAVYKRACRCPPARRGRTAGRAAAGRHGLGDLSAAVGRAGAAGLAAATSSSSRSSRRCRATWASARSGSRPISPCRPSPSTCTCSMA